MTCQVSVAEPQEHFADDGYGLCEQALEGYTANLWQGASCNGWDEGRQRTNHTGAKRCAGGMAMQDTVSQMQALEAGYQRCSGLANRSSYKIFYGPLHPAPILVLGQNPGGVPAETSSDGTRQAGHRIASASAGWFENGEHDVLDCAWPENNGLKRLLLPLVQSDSIRFRSEIVKTNLAFRRSVKVRDISFDQAIAESRPFIEQILRIVDPRLIILTGVPLSKFVDHHTQTSTPASEQLKDASIRHVVFDAAWITLKYNNVKRLVVQVAHASQFSWTYEKYGVTARILNLLNGAPSSQDDKLKVSRAQSDPEITFPIRATEAVETSNAGSWGGEQPQLHDLYLSWRRAGIESRFKEVHHFASPLSGTKAPGLDGFFQWCSGKNIRAENQQTLHRGIHAVRLVEQGVDFSSAIAEAWKLFPLIRTV